MNGKSKRMNVLKRIEFLFNKKGAKKAGKGTLPAG